MNKETKYILESINFNEDYYEYFTDNNFKIDASNNVFLDKTVPPFVLKELNEGLSNFLKEEIEVKAVNNDESFLEDYIDAFFKDASASIKIYQDRLLIEDNKLTFSLMNEYEEKKVKEFKNKLKDFLGLAGFDMEIDYLIDEALKEDIYKDIETPAIDYDAIKEKQKKAKKKAREEENAKIIKGRIVKGNPVPIKNLYIEEENIIIQGYIFSYEEFAPKDRDFTIVTLGFTDDNGAIYVKVFEKDEKVISLLAGASKKQSYLIMKGRTKYDKYLGDELVFMPHSISYAEAPDKEKVVDNAENKRVELHTHTMMSTLDGVPSSKELFDFVIGLGHKALAVTDHDGCQAFPELFSLVNSYNKGKEEKDRFKLIYGAELSVVDDNVDIYYGEESSASLLNDTFVVFDTETTGFNAGGADQMIEIGAVRIKKGKVIDRFDELINPGKPLPSKITSLTGITDEMLLGKRSEEEVTKAFLEYVGSDVLVAHNAKFDISFVKSACHKYNLGEFNHTVLDTLAISRYLNTESKRHSLSALVKLYGVSFDEDSHHRADYDAEGTAKVFYEMSQQLAGKDILKVNDLNKLANPETIYKNGRAYHINVLCKNKKGLKNLFILLSLGLTKYFYKGTGRIPRKVLEEHREGLLFGSGCYLSEIFTEARSKTESELIDLINFYDYVEVQPLDVYDHLLQTGEFSALSELKDHVKKIISATKTAGKIMVATGDVHHLVKEDKIYREILVNQKIPKGGLHPLNKKSITSIPSQHMRTTSEMLKDFSFLEDDLLAEEIVITNTQKIADMVEEIEVIPQTGGVPFSPRIKDSAKIVKDMVYEKARSIYGEELPKLIETRLEDELKGIIGGGFDVIYLIAQKLVKKSNDDGYVVGSRGSVGSSFVATMMGITEVNPLPAHYVCPKCKYSEFQDEEGKDYAFNYSSGYDLPDKTCPKCGEALNKEGQDMPFATFLGFHADKVPDIDLNFSGDYQAKAHEYTKVLFGVDNVYKAGTISTVANKTAQGFVYGYFKEKGLPIKEAEKMYLAAKIEGAKRSTGQHPGGIVVIPDYMDVSDFTPFQYPAGDIDASWRTTHFDYHAIDECVLKLDILGHDDPTILRMLHELSGIDIKSIPLDDPKVISLLSSTEALGVTENQIETSTGTMGLPELGTFFVMDMLNQTKPKTFGELVKISGLSHGTDVWQGNASELIANNVVPFKDVIGCRDDIMVSLIKYGMDKGLAFKIMEFVRKGKASKDPTKWEEYAKAMEEAKVPKWFIESCRKIKYMFPKAHACAYVMSAMRIAWFKVHKPLYFYASYFSIRENDFDIKAMTGGLSAINKRIEELRSLGFDAKDKEKNILNNLLIAREAVLRGVKFLNIDLNKSDDKNFLCVDEENALIPPFRVIDGLGLKAAETIKAAREKEFISVSDLSTRGKVSKNVIEMMRDLGVLEGLPETNQLSLF